MKADVSRSNGLTPAERQRLVERHVEAMALRNLEEDWRLMQTIKAGQIVNSLKAR